MEALDGTKRQSGILSIINRESLDRINTDRSYTSAPTMAATAVISPASMYSNGPPPQYPSWSATSAHATSGLVSPPESRRTSDPKTDPPPLQTAQPHRQSLPSIHEALGPKPNPYASPVSAHPTSHPLPYSQSQAPSIPRSYPPSDHAPYPTHIATSQPRQPSPPQPVHPQSIPFSRTDATPSNFTEVSRHPSIANLQTAPAPPNPYAGPRYEVPRYEPDPRAAERIPNGYVQHPPPQQQGSYVFGPAPDHGPGPNDPAYNQARFPSRDAREVDPTWKGGREEATMHTTFKQGLKRQFFNWDFETYLSEINVGASVLCNWSEHFHTITQEQQPRDPAGVPDRMPSLDSINEMLQNHEKIKICLEKMREKVTQHENAMVDQQMRENEGKGQGYYEDEMRIFNDDMKNQGYGGPESKKRRGRAAPPGRCHSCNRAETPEWRRGPDGARTLCNACGLHYAKLTRKNTMKQSQSSNGSSLRPKSMDDVSPRPI